MTLQSIAEYNPEYFKETSLENDLISRSVFIGLTNEEIGIVSDVLVDEAGHFRYLVVDSSWLAERQFLLPIGRCRAIRDSNAIALIGIDDKQILEQIPPYHNELEIDFDYEEALRSIYRQSIATDEAEALSYDRNSYSYDREPDLYQVSDEDSQTIKLYEERLITNKQRNEIGEVTVSKRIVTETEEVTVPVEKERVVVKRTDVTEATPVEPGTVNFEEGEIARVKVYEETANIEKKAFVREEVEIKKEAEKEVVTASETLRKEELEIQGKENVEMES